eukprot:maker-scaffold877_size102761-snap-gene-0.12 protein:Tk03561 transcript:maker-scaffold877_size102761-snap-gene-0.12-mRNA-1 annotation:"PREDICTED: uncharacterized protein LOC100161421"
MRLWKDEALEGQALGGRGFKMKSLLECASFSIFLGLLFLQYTETQNSSRDGRLVSLFQIVRFPNDPCIGTASKNGTCYTADECSTKGGSSAGNCASGYGVCCTFTLNCGASSTENCTYFESTGGEVGACRATVCPCSDNICQLRLDFDQFVISGPSTLSVDPVSILTKGQPDPAGANSVTAAGQCLTDTFTATDPGGCSPPSICGINTGEHMYLDSHQSCNDLLFQLGQRGVGAGVATRQWSIKVTQYSCDYKNLAPDGCTQYYFGPTTDTVQTFNYQGGKHLANQNQNICIRRERGNCRVCYATALDTDFSVSGMVKSMGLTMGKCCNYGSSAEGFDCVIIPGARKSTDTAKMAAVAICGNGMGLVSATMMGPKTICTNRQPFNLRFRSDGYEALMEMGMAGFKLSYIQSSIGC